MPPKSTRKRRAPSPANSDYSPTKKIATSSESQFSPPRPRPRRIVKPSVKKQEEEEKPPSDEEGSEPIEWPSSDAEVVKDEPDTRTFDEVIDGVSKSSSKIKPNINNSKEKTPEPSQPLTPQATPKGKSPKKMVVEIPVTPKKKSPIKKDQASSQTPKEVKKVTNAMAKLVAKTPEVKSKNVKSKEFIDVSDEDEDIVMLDRKSAAKSKTTVKSDLTAQKLNKKSVTSKNASKSKNYTLFDEEAQEDDIVEQSDDAASVQEEGEEIGDNNSVAEEAQDDEYVKDGFVVSDEEVEQEDRDDEDENENKENEEIQPMTSTEVMASNPAIVNRILDVEFQSEEEQEIYNELGTNVLPSKQLRKALEFTFFDYYRNLGNCSTDRYHWLQDIAHIKSTSLGRPVPAVFLHTGIVLNSHLRDVYNPNAKYSDSFCKKIATRPFQQAYRLEEAALGEMLGENVFHGSISGEGGLLFQTKKFKWNKSPSRFGGSAFDPPMKSTNSSDKALTTAFPGYLLYNDEVPIYDGRSDPKKSQSGFVARAGKFLTLNKLPKLTKEVETDSLVTVGYTVSRFAKITSTSSFSNGTTYPSVFFNILFVILLANPPRAQTSGSSKTKK
ncbi:hypothetical protein VNI00_015520 [Paramarasmius palmivorus]|uniref:Uncharacterized protein n=1 Tax=Paramarasmius palmivorus TaxID=297713 RepID=A0AAW0BKV4_9AGAR